MVYVYWVLAVPTGLLVVLSWVAFLGVMLANGLMHQKTWN